MASNKDIRGFERPGKGVAMRRVLFLPWPICLLFTPRLKSTLQFLPPDTVPVLRYTSQNIYRAGDLKGSRQAVFMDPERYLQVPYTTLVRSAFGPQPEVPMILKNLNKAICTLPPSQSNLPEDKAFEPLGQLISKVFKQTPTCSFSFAAHPSITPLSSHSNTSRPDAYITRPHTSEAPWFDIAIPFEFKLKNNEHDKYDNEQKIIWSLHNIMREDPLRRFAFGITVEDTNMRIWCSNRAFLAASQPINYIEQIDDVISLFYSIGGKTMEELGWDPTVERMSNGRYKFMIGGQRFTTTRVIAEYGADAMVGRGTRVYEAWDENGKTVVIKDSWRDKDRESEGAILGNIFKDIREKLGEEKETEAKKYLVQVQIYEDVVINGETDETLVLENENDLQWIIIDADFPTSKSRHSSSTGHIPSSDYLRSKTVRRIAPHRWDKIPCRTHARTVFPVVGAALMQVRNLGDCFSCLRDALQGLYFMHKAGWVHRDFSVANVLWVEEPPHSGMFVGKLTDFEYAKKVDSDISHDVRTGTVDFMAIEVAHQSYLFLSDTPQSGGVHITSNDSGSHAQPSDFGEFVNDLTLMISEEQLPEDSDPPFRMNFLHDLESHWWAAMWILLFHTDKDLPTKFLVPQKMWFESVFPSVINSAERLLFFNQYKKRLNMQKTLSQTYGGAVQPILLFAKYLKCCYVEVEMNYPKLSITNKLLEDIHKVALVIYDHMVMNWCQHMILLQPLDNIVPSKRHEPAGLITQEAKRVKQG